MSVNRVNQSTGELSPIAGGTLYADAPVGSIQAYGGSSAPWGWLLCQGQAISRATYAELFNVIGTSFGEGDGSTTFNIPDLRGEFLRGAGTNSHSGQGSGGSVGEHQNASAIRPTYVTADNNFWIGNGAAQEMVLYADAAITSANSVVKNTYTASGTGSSPALSVRPTNTSVNFIIKATTIALPSDFETAVDDKIADKVGKIVYQNSSIQSVTQTLEPNSLYLGTMYGGATDDGNYRFVELIYTGASSISMTFVLKAATHVSSSYELGTLNYTIQCDNTTLRAYIYKLF